MSYTFRKRLSPEIVGLEHAEHGMCLWTRPLLRKARDCAVCKTKIEAKTHAWSPLTNGYNRMHRICEPCVSKLERDAMPQLAATRSGRTRAGNPSAPTAAKTRTAGRRSRAQ